MKNKVIEIINYQIKMEMDANRIFDTDAWYDFKKSGDKEFNNHLTRTLRKIKDEVQRL